MLGKFLQMIRPLKNIRKTDLEQGSEIHGPHGHQGLIRFLYFKVFRKNILTVDLASNTLESKILNGTTRSKDIDVPMGRTEFVQFYPEKDYFCLR